MLNGALPAVDLTAGGIALALARSCFVAALFSGYGALVFLVWAAPRPRDPAPEVWAKPLRRWGLISLGSAIPAGLVWLVLQTSALSETVDPFGIVSAIPGVLFGTSFGRLMGWQAVALLGAFLMLSRAYAWPALVLAVIATILQAGHGHALAMERGPSLLLASETLHLLGAGAWLGGLVPLWLTVRLAPPDVAAAAAGRFSVLGTVCVAGILASAIFQGWVLIGGLAGLLGTAYGWVAMVKLILFLVMLGFAAINRYVLTPALHGGDPARGRRAMLRSVGLETLVGVLVLAAAGVLTNLQPAMHIQPIWPFTRMPSLITLREEPDFWPEVEQALALLVLAALLLVAALALRRLRWAALAAAIGIAWFALPHLDLLFVEAYPTSFFHSPTGFAASALTDGAALYPRYCAGCHGAEGKGDGPAARELAVPPADLTAAHLWAHSDGELFWWLTHGVDAPEGGLAMPGFADTLSDDQRWDLIDFVRANNAGRTYLTTGHWSPPIAAPGFEATCMDGGALSSQDLRGKILRLVFASPDDARVPRGQSRHGIQLLNVVANAAPDRTPSANGDCSVQGLEVAEAYAIVSGRAPDQMPGGQFLIDGGGMLRRVWWRDQASENIAGRDWNDPAVLWHEIDLIVAEPVENAAGAHVHHH